MKAIALVLISSVLLFSSISVFAATNTMQQQNVQSIHRWLGKPATQLIKKLGKPSYTSSTDGRLTYDYVREPQHVGPIPTYQFVLGRNGKVIAATIAL